MESRKQRNKKKKNKNPELQNVPHLSPIVSVLQLLSLRLSY